jgi:hypothetical protein
LVALAESRAGMPSPNWNDRLKGFSPPQTTPLSRQWLGVFPGLQPKLRLTPEYRFDIISVFFENSMLAVVGGKRFPA